MRILHAASSYPLTPRDTTAPFMEEMLGALAQAGNEVTIVVPRVSGLVDGVREGVRVIGAPYAPGALQNWGHGRSLDAAGTLRLSALAVTPLALGSMTRVVRREVSRKDPDVVHLHWVLPQGAIALALPDKVPVVVSVHGADAKFVDGRLRALTERILKRADALVAASAKILDFITAIHPVSKERSRVIHHGADSSLFAQVDRSEARMELGIGADHQVVVGLGRLVEKKGFDHLIRSLEYLPDQSADIFIIGTGPEGSDLERLAASDRRVHFPGIATRREAARWLAAADVVAIPSVEAHRDLDSGPVVLMEALASGRPVVSSLVGMAPEMIEDDVNGYLVDPRDPRAFGLALDKAIRHSTRLGQGARSTFERIGDWSRVADELDDVYSMAIANRQRLTSTD